MSNLLTIPELGRMKIVDQYKRPVLNRVEKDRSAYAEIIFRMGTGIRDMIRRCKEAGLPEPEFQLTDGFVLILRRQKRDAGELTYMGKPGTKLSGLCWKPGCCG